MDKELNNDKKAGTKPMLATGFLDLIIQEIETFTKVENQWDGQGALPLLIEVYNNSKLIILKLKINPSDFYPNPNGTLSIDYERNKNGVYLEIGKTEFSFYTKGEKVEFKNIIAITEENLNELEIFVNDYVL